jgi:hypothetical protein
MKVVILKNWYGKRYVVSLYEGIQETPIMRTHEFYKLLLLDLGVGSDMDSVGRHFSAFYGLLKSKSYNELFQEAANLHNNYYFILEGINVKSFCFASMVASIDGKQVTDMSEGGVKKLLKQLSDYGLKDQHVTDITDEIKKKLISNLEPLFLIDLENMI